MGEKMIEFNYIDPDKIEAREYQLTDAVETVSAILRGVNVGVVYPTGSGKTIAGFLTADHFLPKGKILFLAPTNVLCGQHHADAVNLFRLPAEEINQLTGKTPQKKRAAVWQKSRIVVSTPQTISNELTAGRIDFGHVAFVVFDEMHMAFKKYAYVKIAQLCLEKDIRTMGLTASPGSAAMIDKLEENYNLGWWIYRSAQDLRKFIFPKNEKPVIVGYTDEHNRAMRFLRASILKLHNDLAESGLIEPIAPNMDLGRRIQFLLLTELNKLYPLLTRWVENQKKKDQLRSNGQRFLWYNYVVLYGAYYRLMHLLTLFVTENYQVALGYIDKLAGELVNLNQDDEAPPYYKNNSAARIWNNEDFHRFRRMVVDFVDRQVAHPKLARLFELISKKMKLGNRILVFSNFKGSIDVIRAELEKRNVRSEVIAGNKFMKTKDQRLVLDDFRNGDTPILLTTTVLEAGIHVSKIDVVINYSMPHTGRALIQRGGRAGRTAIGEVYYLIMDNSHDSSLFFADRAENKSMDREMRRRLTIQMARLSGDAIYYSQARELPLSRTANKEIDSFDPLEGKRKPHGRILPAAKKRREPELFPLKKGG